MQSPGSAALRLAAGVLFGALVGVSACAVAGAIIYGIERAPPNAEPAAVVAGWSLAVPAVLLVPMGMGFAAAYIWRPLKLKVLHLVGLSLLLTGVALAGSLVFLGEGYLCLLLASPLLLVCVFAGMLIGRRALRRAEGALQTMAVPIVFAVMVADLNFRASRDGVVVDELLVYATPEAIWPHVIAFPEITTNPTYWLNRIGLPAPSETTCAGAFVGADRACIFSNGLVFKERVSQLERQRLLTFDIVEQPNDPELLGHVDLHRGQFELRPNADGTTTLIGRSWYTLHVRPLFYFDWWTRDITREVHLRVMRHIKQLAENGG